MSSDERGGGEWAEPLQDLGIDTDAADRMARFLELLTRWGSAVDLFAGARPDTVLGSLVREALAALPWVGEGGTLLDIGSGNGFPAVPLLIARPGLHGVLLEPRERRWAFLKEAVRELGLDAEVRRERVAEHPGSGYELGTVRGVEMKTWLPETARLLREGGSWLWWTSETRAAELSNRVTEGHVLTFTLPGSERGVLAVWRRCST
ncbi:MAG: RsmG family class I SAM-dependent methyltransferase [Thermoanaerobaculaceae bacterium]|jgi:16S rRNA (guanine527-N7)-methyltransferase